jgi:NADPH-ferrihemoprotein reductase
MAQLDTLDIIVLAVLLLGTVAYFTKGTYWGIVKEYLRQIKDIPYLGAS